MPHGGTIITFPGKESDEQIFIYVRRHPIAFLPIFMTILLMTILGLVMIYFIGLLSGGAFSSNSELFLSSGFLLFMALFTLIEFFDFYFDLHIVTDRRIIDIDQEKLFNRNVGELLLDDVQDVDAKVKGIFATLFDFGDVGIQTAGAKPNFVFEQIPHPKEVAAIILDLSDQEDKGIPPENRHPEGPVAAVIQNKMFPHTKDHENEIP
jgi:uncharacterized membrane protein YdbT with pleckstrin-like domain